MATVKKVLLIKNPIDFNPVTEDYINRLCRILENAIYAILNSQQIDISYEELYRIVENLQTCNQRSFLYNNLHLLIENTLIQKLDSFLLMTSILSAVDGYWLEYSGHVGLIRNIFLYFDRSSKNCTYNTIQSMSVNLFKLRIVQCPEIRRKITAELLGEIAAERQGERIDLRLMKSVIGMLNEMQNYEELFEVDFLKASEAFYLAEGNKLSDELPIREYINYINKRIEEEQQRAMNYLNKSTFQAIHDLLYKYLVTNHIIKLLNKGFDFLLDNNCLQELKSLHDLLSKVSGGLKHLLTYLFDYCLRNGSAIAAKTNNDKNFIQDLIDFKDKLDDIVKTSFRNGENFYEVVKNSFVKFLSTLQNRPAQLLAKYVDGKLRNKDITDEDLELIFNKVMVLFRFMQGKDVFEAFYKRHLAKRLLLAKSTSQDAENSMIAKLKIECGAAFTSKIEGMFKDINISQSVNAAFKQYINSHNEDEKVQSDLSINVLTSSFWPNYPTFDVNLPMELIKYQVVFQKFYEANHSGRKLLWQPSLGHCVIKAVFDSGNKELQVSLFQTLVLLMFNISDKFLYTEIKEMTNLEEGELKKTLISLACGKSRVLIRQAAGGKEISEEDSFVFNRKFTDKLFRVRINQVQLKESPEEQKAAEKSVLIDRQFQIDAAIVRIMKKRKCIGHNELLGELFNTLDIPVKPYDLKKRIELLIEREYMERDKDNPSNYNYIA